MVTVYRDHDRIFAALKAGACGYLLKRSTPAEVREAIHAVRAGGAPMSAEIARRVVEAFHQPSTPVTGLDDVKLSRRERAFLVSIALQAQQDGVWLCEKSPLTVVFHCAPSLHCVSMNYPDAFVDYLLMRLVGCN